MYGLGGWNQLRMLGTLMLEIAYLNLRLCVSTCRIEIWISSGITQGELPHRICSHRGANFCQNHFRDRKMGKTNILDVLFSSFLISCGHLQLINPKGKSHDNGAWVMCSMSLLKNIIGSRKMEHGSKGQMENKSL